MSLSCQRQQEQQQQKHEKQEQWQCVMLCGCCVFGLIVDFNTIKCLMAVVAVVAAAAATRWSLG